ncbi:hypothetical protein JNW88_30510, partial [Micromonospora sp. ATA32]|nr:hypothetical protein [Micromonospora sp. ATA32]
RAGRDRDPAAGGGAAGVAPTPAPPNPGLQDADHLPGLLVWLALLWTGIALRCLLRRPAVAQGRRTTRRNDGRRLRGTSPAGRAPGALNRAPGRAAGVP